MISPPSFYLFRGNFMVYHLCACLILGMGTEGSIAQPTSGALPNFLQQSPTPSLEVTLERWNQAFGPLPKEAQELIAENTFARHRALLEGELCLDPVLTPFVERVLNRLLKQGGELPMTPQIAVIYSTQPNAFATPQGWGAGADWPAGPSYL